MSLVEPGETLLIRLNAMLTFVFPRSIADRDKNNRSVCSRAHNTTQANIQQKNRRCDSS